MFNFFKKSKKDDERNGSKKTNKEKESKENKTLLPSSSEKTDSSKLQNGLVNNKEVKLEEPAQSAQTASFEQSFLSKNKHQPSSPDAELAPVADSISLPKNVVNAPKTIGDDGEVVIRICEKNNEVNDSSTIIKMCDPYSSNNGLKISGNEGINRITERRGSCVKPCGHGTTAISPRVPPLQSKPIQKETPPGSPVMEVKKTFKFTVNGIHQGINNNSENGEEKISKKEIKEIENVSVVASSKSPYSDFENRLELEKKNLINQEAKFQSQLNDLTKELTIRDAEATKLRFQMEDLQRDVFAKAAGMDRLQTELNMANKESELVRQKIRYLENELENYRKRNLELNEQLQNKSDSYNNYEEETQSKINELEGVIKNLRLRIETLESQINELKEEKENLQAKHAELQSDRDEEQKKLAATLETTSKQKEEIGKKWKIDFEKLRTVNIVKEQELLDDFEWKLREVQQMCKKKLDDKEKLIEERLQQAYKEAGEKMGEAQKMLDELESLKSCEIEVQQLRNRTTEQEKALQQMRAQQNQMLQAETNLKNETKRLLNLIEMEKENLQHIQRIHRQELLDKERKLKDTLNQKRTEIAMYWEEKLLTECSRLKEEMEQIHNEEKFIAMECVRKEKEEEFQKRQTQWENKMRECLKEIENLKKALDQKDEYYHEELIRVRSNTDRDIMELRRLMDKIDMTHHDNYEKLVVQHEEELESINDEHTKQLKDVESHWKSKILDVTSNLERVKTQLENEAQQKMENLVEQHRKELDKQWENLIHQKSEAIQLVEEEYVDKYKALEEHFYTQQKSSKSREIELLKAIDALKNEVQSKENSIDDLQNNVETLEGGVQVLNGEIAQQSSDMAKSKAEADQQIRRLQETIAQLLEEREKERETFRLKFMGNQKQSQETIDHLQRKVNCLTKLFEEVRQRYERRESRQEDLTIISDLKQVIAEQEKDLACINEEKRYFQMRLIQLERHLEQQSSLDEEDFEDAIPQESSSTSPSVPQNRSSFLPTNSNNEATIFIPPTIPEGEE